MIHLRDVLPVILCMTCGVDVLWWSERQGEAVLMVGPGLSRSSAMYHSIADQHGDVREADKGYAKPELINSNLINTNCL